MKTFQDYLKDRNLQDDWEGYRKQSDEAGPAPEPKGWKSDPNEPVREIQQILAKAVDGTQKVNRMGVDDLKAEVVSTEDVSSGQQCRMEIQGTAHAKSVDHIKRLLDKVLATAGPMLKERGIYLYISGQVDANETEIKEDAAADDSPVGLVREYSFRVMATAVIKRKESMPAM
jgi:hypothetical protein